jgi:CRP-like cAMP-binding protein
VLLYEEQSKKHFKLLKKGESFGEIGFFTGLSRACSVQSNGLSRIYRIKREDFLNAIKDNKHDMVVFSFSNQ